MSMMSMLRWTRTHSFDSLVCQMHAERSLIEINVLLTFCVYTIFSVRADVCEPMLAIGQPLAAIVTISFNQVHWLFNLHPISTLDAKQITCNRPQNGWTNGNFNCVDLLVLVHCKLRSPLKNRWVLRFSTFAKWTDVRQRNFVQTKFWLFLHLCNSIGASSDRWMMFIVKIMEVRMPEFMPHSGWYSISIAHSSINCMPSMQCIKVLKCEHRAHHFTGTWHAKPHRLWMCCTSTTSAHRPREHIYHPHGIYLSCDLRLICILVTTLLNTELMRLWKYASGIPSQTDCRSKNSVTKRKITFNFHIERQATWARECNTTPNPSICNTEFLRNQFSSGANICRKTPENSFATCFLNLLVFSNT